MEHVTKRIAKEKRVPQNILEAFSLSTLLPAPHAYYYCLAPICLVVCGYLRQVSHIARPEQEDGYEKEGVQYDHRVVDEDFKVVPEAARRFVKYWHQYDGTDEKQLRVVGQHFGDVRFSCYCCCTVFVFFLLL